MQASLPLFGFRPTAQTPSKGKIAGFDHDLDINVISPLKNKEETFRKLFLKP
ncbi:1,4-beta-N-acetylmuramidase [Streptococcus pneumoniae]|nr:1,4-beta-N-acetylmuramidase [Streptococcus pneumoniae]